ncbi:MAG: hypothetical protein DELT_02825 [Desulfovibrio sp.]
MKPFHFSLEQVLGYRKQLEEQAMLVFTRAVQARDKRLREKLECEAEIEKAHARLADISALDADERWLVSGYISALTHDIQRAERDLIILEQEVDRCRTDLTQKVQDRKLLEKLKEKQAKRYTQAENHKEQQSYDDIATTRFSPPAF